MDTKSAKYVRSLAVWRLEPGGRRDADEVSAISVSQKHRQMAETLGLVLLDARYLPEARRMAVRRNYGNLPEGLLLLNTPTSFWHLPFELRLQDPRHQAQDLVYDGLRFSHSFFSRTRWA